MSLLARISEIENEIAKTQKNKVRTTHALAATVGTG
jgi:ribosome-interacting GTPase 1